MDDLTVIRGAPSGTPRLPFAGTDGEGGDIDGCHEYLLLRAGDHVLETGRPLMALECLAFLADLPKTHIYVAFAFDYDVTMILRSLPPDRLWRLLHSEVRRKDVCSQAYPVDYGRFQIDYMPHKEFRVRRRDGGKWTIIHDSFTFFQEAFARLKADDTVSGALVKWLGDEPELEDTILSIARGKAQRSAFTRMTDYEREYNHLECILLARMMEKYRSMCDRIGIRPTKWQGPGYLVTAFFKREKFPRKKDITVFQDFDFYVFVSWAFYGGRFEPCIFGDITGPVHQWDINSAYASIYDDLPCMLHTRWNKTYALPSGGIYAADVEFHHPAGYKVHTLPIRTDKGTLIFPRTGRGIYWCYEIAAAQRADCDVRLVGDCYEAEVTCDCRLFDKVQELYAERQRLGSSTQGRPLKLMLATIYGKFAQSIGCGPYANIVYAGMITSSCRAQISDAALQDGRNGDDVIMIATDGLFTREARNLPVSKMIGEWDHVIHDSIFMVQSGVYFLPPRDGVDKLKTRGVPIGKMLEHEIDFRAVWARWLDNPDYVYPPEVCIPMHNFIGLRLAIARNKPETAGRWVDIPKTVKFDWESKRTPRCVSDGMLFTVPIQGSRILESLPYDHYAHAERDLERVSYDDQPDWSNFL